MDHPVILIVIGIFTTIVGALIYHRLIDPYRFKKEGGTDIGGHYCSAWYRTEKPDDPDPIVKEVTEIRQSGRKITIKNRLCNKQYDYKATARVESGKRNMIVGSWRSVRPRDSANGAIALHREDDGTLIGMWSGRNTDDELVYGWWVMTNDESTRDRVISKFNDLGFKTLNLLEALRD